MIKKFCAMLSLLALLAFSANDPVRAVESYSVLSQETLTSKVEKLINKYNEIIELKTQESSLDIKLFEEHVHKMTSFAENQGMCVSLSTQWLSSIRQSDSPDEGSDLFINGLKRIADINEEFALDSQEMVYLADFCQKTMDIQSLSNRHLANLLQSEWVQEQIGAGYIKQMPKNSLGMNLLGEQSLQYQLVCYDFERLYAIMKTFQKSPDVVQMIVIGSDLFAEKMQKIKEAADVKTEDLSDCGHGVGFHFDPSTKRFYFYDPSEVSDCLKEHDENSLEQYGSFWTKDAVFMARKFWFFHDEWEIVGQVFGGVIQKCMIVANASTIETFLGDQDDWLEKFDDVKVQEAMCQNALLILLLHATPKEIRDYVWGKILLSAHQRWKRITGRELRGLDQEGGQSLYNRLMEVELRDVLTVLNGETKETMKEEMIILLEQWGLDLKSEAKTPQEETLLEGLQQFLHNHQQHFMSDSSYTIINNIL